MPRANSSLATTGETPAARSRAAIRTSSCGRIRQRLSMTVVLPARGARYGPCEPVSEYRWTRFKSWYDGMAFRPGRFDQPSYMGTDDGALFLLLGVNCMTAKPGRVFLQF